jgi:hypothetical protein
MKLIRHLIFGLTLMSLTVDGQINSFVAQSMGTKAELHWKASAEKAGQYFTIERSSDSKTWKEIGQVNSLENTSEVNKYKFTDKGPLDGEFFYRVIQNIPSKETIASAPASIQSFSFTNVFEILPSDITKNTFTILSDANTDLTVANETGEIVKTILLSESNDYQYVLRDLTKGIYVLAGTNYNGTLRSKIMVDTDN